MGTLNTDSLSKERQEEVLRRAIIEFRGLAIDSPRVPFISKIIKKIAYRKLLNSETLLEFMAERLRLHEEGIYLGTLEEVLTIPYIGLTKEELYSMGLDKERVDHCMKANYEEVFIMTDIVGKEIYEKVHAYRK